MRQEMSNTNSTGADGAMEEGPIPALGPSRARAAKRFPAPCCAERAPSAYLLIRDLNLTLAALPRLDRSLVAASAR